MSAAQMGHRVWPDSVRQIDAAIARTPEATGIGALIPGTTAPTLHKWGPTAGSSHAHRRLNI